MSIKPKQLAELEKKLSSVQNPTYSVAELCSLDELVNQLMPALIAAARELDSLKWRAGLKIQQMDREITGLQKQIMEFMEREKAIVDLLVPKQSEGSLADVILKAIEPSAPPGCDFPDPIAKGGSNE